MNSAKALSVSLPLAATRTFFCVAGFRICFRSFHRKENLSPFVLCCEGVVNTQRRYD